jgi:uncharacterized lipoprotein YajG
MKKTFIIFASLALSACTHYDQNIKFDFTVDGTNSYYVESKAKINVKVIDDRAQRVIIGSKEFCDNHKISISSEENLAEVIEKKINAGLAQKGFKKGNDKLIEISLKQFDYKAECGFVTGRSKANAVVKVTVIAPSNKMEIAKNFLLSLENTHFFLPLATTDEKTINQLLEKIIADILDNEAFLQTLQK